MNETAPKRKSGGRPRKQFEVHITMVAVPLPPEKRWEYERAWRLIGEMIRKENAPPWLWVVFIVFLIALFVSAADGEML